MCQTKLANWSTFQKKVCKLNVVMAAIIVPKEVAKIAIRYVPDNAECLLGVLDLIGPI